ncbi:low-density lipoprotein receptor activity [Nesidiocoris tenuis]|uniref:Low-density lipoprotein receptor activity n=1 Tax=Nesidiocoris tenuis TaxID=355587 RepID=A0ABN7AL92_9HEMI|nr:low-density lipoprotein receptor activity [Nesidiocoris tenuis]
MGWLRFLSLLVVIAIGSVGAGNDVGVVDTFRSFACRNGQSIQKAWMCDGEDDCGDNSDEDHPECVSSVPCDPATQFTCRDNGRCIPLALKCDREPDCGDGSDEDSAMCMTTDCQAGQFKCAGDLECVPMTWVCDGTKDCNNGADEAHCNRTCTDKEFSCGDDSKSLPCVDISWRCDGDLDCPNGADEVGCAPKNKCAPKMDFTCSDGSCVPLRFLCDGDFDCADRSDENNCTDGRGLLKTCRDNQFECPDRKTCIHKSWLCDEEWDCPDGADEAPGLCARSCARGMFRCANSECVPGAARCDGVRDCADSSDETGCDKRTSHCPPHEFDCGSGLCLPADSACNGIRECSNGADESALCGINECLTANGGCDHACVDLPIGHRCKCHDGYRLAGNSSCVDVNECTERAGSCSQECHNTDGSFTCSCAQGYHKDPADPTRCRADVRNAFVVFTKRDDVRKLSLDSNEISIIVNDTKKSSALDVHYKNQEIFWSEMPNSAIYKSDIDGLAPRKVVVDSDVQLVEGLAVDWIHGNLYWTDTGKKTVEVASLDGVNRKILVRDDLDEPRAMVVDPIDGWMYWSDWGENARIERAGMDGSNRHKIVVHSIEWPNGLTLDIAQRRIFWADAKLGAVYSANVDGSDRHLVIKSKDHLHHPYSVAVFEDWVYWSDWTSQMIYRADKLNGGRLHALAEPRTLQNPMTIQVYHPYKQPQDDQLTNACPTASCSHLCLPSPKLRATHNLTVVCACPDNLALSGDLRTCITPSPTSTSAPKKSADAHPSAKIPPIYIDFLPPEVPSLAEQAREINWWLVMVIILAGSFLTTFILVSVCACAYKLYLHGNFHIMNFDNPIYHKTPTQDPLCTVDSSEPSESDEVQHSLVCHHV